MKMMVNSKITNQPKAQKLATSLKKTGIRLILKKMIEVRDKTIQTTSLMERQEKKKIFQRYSEMQTGSSTTRSKDMNFQTMNQELLIIMNENI